MSRVMSNNKDKQKKPLVLSTIPSANWKRFIAEQSVPDNPKKKFKPSKNPHKGKLPKLPPSKMDVAEILVDLYPGLPDVCALDCEMVGVENPQKSMLARVSIVNMSGVCIYDKFVKPSEQVTDYRTWVSGIRPRDLKKGEAFDVVKSEVAVILKDKIVVGHAVSNDFKALKLQHPKRLIRDTSHFPTFREMFNGRTPGLRNLARVILGVNIQTGEHSSVQDARATLQLYMTYRREWEEYIAQKHSSSKKRTTHGS